MRDFFRSLRFKILLGIVAIFLGFILFEASTGQISSPSQLLGIIASPFQKLTSAISSGISGVLDPIVHSGDYKKENEELRKEISDLHKQLADYEDLKTQNEQLRDIAGIKEIHQDYDLEPATIIARDPSDPYCAFQINRGSMHGVEKGDVVMTNEGLIGQVSAVGLTYAHVMTVLDPNLSISCYEIKTKEAGVLTGDLELASDGMCKMLHLEKDTAINKGYIIVTSGSSGVFPEGLEVGTVQQIDVQENGISSYAVVKPTVNINTVTEVMVLKGFTGQGEAVPDITQSSDQNSSATRQE